MGLWRTYTCGLYRSFRCFQASDDCETYQRSDGIAHGQEFRYRHLLLLRTPGHVGERDEDHGWGSRGHEHHGEPKHGVVIQNTRLRRESVDEGNTNPVIEVSTSPD